MKSIDNTYHFESGIRILRRKCTVICKIHDVTGSPSLRRSKPDFSGLARIIVAQQLSFKSAHAIWQRFENTIQPITASTVLQLDDEVMRAAGLSRIKIRSLRALANTIMQKELNLEEMIDFNDDDIRTLLISIPGIGPWTADMFLMFCLGRPDIFAPGDLALQLAAQKAFGLVKRPSFVELTKLSIRWRPWRSIAAQLLWSYYNIIKSRK
ncbi:MAG: hypothetical protein TECD_00761 [Hyphomicrobiaceae bacterium hypho_1]